MGGGLICLRLGVRTFLGTSFYFDSFGFLWTTTLSTGLRGSEQWHPLPSVVIASLCPFYLCSLDAYYTSLTINGLSAVVWCLFFLLLRNITISFFSETNLLAMANLTANYSILFGFTTAMFLNATSYTFPAFSAFAIANFGIF